MNLFIGAIIGFFVSKLQEIYKYQKNPSKFNDFYKQFDKPKREDKHED